MLMYHDVLSFFINDLVLRHIIEEDKKFFQLPNIWTFVDEAYAFPVLEAIFLEVSITRV